MPSVLLLGAGSDIAVATAHLYGKKGYDLLLAARKPDKLEYLKKDLQIRYGRKVSVYAFDACNWDSHESFYQQLKEKPEITVCVFGYMVDEALALESWEEASRMINTNFTGAVSILNIIARDYMQRGTGSIVGISSVAGERGRQSKMIYGSAKAAFSTYLSGLRNLAYRSGVHVLTVKPGFVQTKMTEGLDLPKPLTAKPEEVAEAIYSGIKNKEDTVYVKWFWKYIMLNIKLIPEKLFKRMNI